MSERGVSSATPAHYSDAFSFPWAGHILGPLIIWLTKRGDSTEIDANGKESLNFQISMLIYNLIAGILCLVLIGFVILAILHLLNRVLVIVASSESRRRKVLSLSACDSADQVICSVIPSGARDLTQGNEITLTGLCDRARR